VFTDKKVEPLNKTAKQNLRYFHWPSAWAVECHN